MAIKYLDAKRIRGSSTGSVGTQSYNAGALTNVTLSNSNLTATSTSSAWGNKAYSTLTFNPANIASGEVYQFTFTTSDDTKNGMVGFDRAPASNSGAGNSDMDFGMYLVGNASSQNYISTAGGGSENWNGGQAYTTSSVLKMTMDSSGNVKFYIGGSQFGNTITGGSGDYHVVFYPYDSGFNTTITSWSDPTQDEKATLVTAGYKSAGFDGANDNAISAGSLGISLGNNYSFGGWANPEAQSSSIGMALYMAGALYLYRLSGVWKTEGNGISITGSTDVGVDSWKHVMVNVVSGTATLYIDGVADGTDANTNSSVTISQIQMGEEGTSYEYKGNLTDWFFYSRALTTAEIASLVGGAKVSSISQTNLEANYTFDSNLNDRSSNSRHLATVTGDVTGGNTKGTSPITPTSNLPDNTIFEETDTRQTYFLQDNTGISKAGCLGYWKFQEQSGNVINHATTANGFTDGLGSAADAVPDSGLKRNAVGKFRPYAYEWLDTGTLSLDVPNQTALSSGLQGDLTITMWVYPTLNYDSNGRIFIAKRDATSTTTYEIYWGASNVISYYIGTEYNSTMNSNAPLTLNAWNFVVATVASNELTQYLNGYKLLIAGSGSDYTHTIASRQTNTAPLTFDQSSLNNTEEYAGRIQDCTIWNRALSEAELTAMYNSGRGVADIVNGVGWYR